LKNDFTWNAETGGALPAIFKRSTWPGSEEAEYNPQMVVVHWTAIDNIEVTFEVFDPRQLGGRPT